MLVVITPPQATAQDLRQYNQLLKLGLQCLYLRLPGRSRLEYEEALLAIAPEYRHRVVLCDHFELATIYGIGGIHLRADQREEYARWSRSDLRLSTSAHSIEELRTLPFIPTYALLSPIYESISKPDYRGAIELEECRQKLGLLGGSHYGLSRAGRSSDDGGFSRLPLASSAIPCWA